MGLGDMPLILIGVHDPGGGQLGVIGYAVGEFSMLPRLMQCRRQNRQ